MDNKNQWEALSLLSAYATVILERPSADIRPSTAKAIKEAVQNMNQLVNKLDCVS